jgi:hypothetical protein
MLKVTKDYPFTETRDMDHVSTQVEDVLLDLVILD